MRLLALFFVLSSSFLFAADETKPHSHQGIVKPYDGAPPEVPLSESELKTIDAGQPVFKQIDSGSGGRAIAAFKVNASPHTTWKVISDFDNYPKWISNLSKAKIYKKEGDKIFVEFTIKVWPTTTTYFVEHNYPMEKKGWGTWKLDYNRLSDLEESVGFWRVNPVQGHPDQSLVIYSIDIRVGALLNLIKGFIVDKGLKEATQWVKVQAESLSLNNKNAMAQLPQEGSAPNSPKSK